MSGMHRSKAETRILDQYWKPGTCSVREILDSLPEDERVAYATVQTLVYRPEHEGALRRVRKIGNARRFESLVRWTLVGCLALLAPTMLMAQHGNVLGEDVRPFVRVGTPKVVLAHVQIIDGTGGAASADRNVYLTDGKITAI
jgi:hypothetical protein